MRTPQATATSISFLELSQGVAANRLDQENALPTDAKATWCLVPVSNVASAFQVVDKQTGDCMFTRGDLGGPIYAQPCIGQLGEDWAVNRGSYNGDPVVWFTSYYWNVNVDVYQDRRSPGPRSSGTGPIRRRRRSTN